MPDLRAETVERAVREKIRAETNLSGPRLHRLAAQITLETRAALEAVERLLLAALADSQAGVCDEFESDESYVRELLGATDFAADAAALAAARPVDESQRLREAASEALDVIEQAQHRDIDCSSPLLAEAASSLRAALTCSPVEPGEQETDAYERRLDELANERITPPRHGGRGRWGRR